MAMFYICKICAFLIIGFSCLLETVFWRAGSLPPFKGTEGHYWSHAVFSLSAPAFTIVYGVLSFWSIVAYLEEMEHTGITDLTEAIFASFGFCLFFTVTMIVAVYRGKDDDVEPYIIMVVVNMLLAIIQLGLAVIMCLKYQSKDEN